MPLSRRSFLGTACSAAAWPLATPVVLAETPGENRLVIIVLRGALDGLDLAAPHDDPDLARLRPVLAARPGADLDGRFALGAPFSGLMPLWEAGELGIVHAVSTPYRDKRSHFDGQDILEIGSPDPDGVTRGMQDGWLNRVLAEIPGARTETAIAVGRARMLLLEGDAPAASWSPASTLTLEDTAQALLARMYSTDPLFAEAFAEAQMLAGGGGGQSNETGATLARYTAQRLLGPARVAAFSLSGWDTHRRQDRTLNRPAKQLSLALATLKQDLGPVWEKTAVLAMTEFGRTVRENGSAGTDHGTGGAMILSGGAIKGGQIYGSWPGLGDGKLYEDRDLMPTDDLRRWAGWAVRDMLGMPASTVERAVFPGIDLGTNPRFLA
ncbi:MAG: DUF1501 domain-containing protein [Pseudomonadota bacterium]